MSYRVPLGTPPAVHEEIQPVPAVLIPAQEEPATVGDDDDECEDPTPVGTSMELTAVESVASVVEFLLSRSLTDVLAHYQPPDPEFNEETGEEQMPPLPTITLAFECQGLGDGPAAAATTTGRVEISLSDAGGGIPKARPQLGRLIRSAFQPITSTAATYQAAEAHLARVQMRTARVEESCVRAYDILLNISDNARQIEFIPPLGRPEEKDPTLGDFSGTQFHLAVREITPAAASVLLQRIHTCCLQSSLLTSTDASLELAVSGLPESRAVEALGGEALVSAALQWESIPDAPAEADEVESRRGAFPGFVVILDNNGSDDNHAGPGLGPVSPRLVLKYGNPLPDDMESKLDFFYFASQGLAAARRAMGDLHLDDKSERSRRTEEEGAALAPAAGAPGAGRRGKLLVGVGLSGADAIASQREARGLRPDESESESESESDESGEDLEGGRPRKKAKRRRGKAADMGISIQAAVLMTLGGGGTPDPRRSGLPPSTPTATFTVPVYLWENRVVGPCEGSKGVGFKFSAPQIRNADWSTISLRPSRGARRPKPEDLARFGRPFAVFDLVPSTAAQVAPPVGAGTGTAVLSPTQLQLPRRVVAVCLHLYNERDPGPHSFPGVGEKGPGTQIVSPLIKAAVTAAIQDVKQQAGDALQSGLEIRVRDVLPHVATSVAAMACRDPALTVAVAELLACEDPGAFQGEILRMLRRVVLGPGADRDAQLESEESEDVENLRVQRESGDRGEGDGPGGLGAESTQIDEYASFAAEDEGDFDPFADLIELGSMRMGPGEGEGSGPAGTRLPFGTAAASQILAALAPAPRALPIPRPWQMQSESLPLPQGLPLTRPVAGRSRAERGVTPVGLGLGLGLAFDVTSGAPRPPLPQHVEAPPRLFPAAAPARPDDTTEKDDSDDDWRF